MPGGQNRTSQAAGIDGFAMQTASPHMLHISPDFICLKVFEIDGTTAASRSVGGLEDTGSLVGIAYC
jgi:hypothetical protein